MSGEPQVFVFDTLENVLIVVLERKFMKLRDSDQRNARNKIHRRLMDGTTKHLIFEFSKLD